MLESVSTLVKLLVFPGFVFAIFLALAFEWIDRKFYAKLQNRVGPLYTGPSWILQPLADLIKLLSKEDITPGAADKPFFNSMPALAAAIMLTAVTLLPITAHSGLVSF